MIKALIFDFDGLILDTEWPDYLSWQRVYRQHGCELAVTDWGQIVGGDAESDFDPYVHLETLCGQPIDRDEIWISRRKEYLEDLDQQEVLPGVLSLLEDSERLGLQRAVASSSPENWVRGHLARLGLYQRFEAIKTADDVQQIKPNPELYLAALGALGVAADEAIVFEDSPNGVTAARAAGIFCVAVPTQVTAQLQLDHADLRLGSLAEMPLVELIQHIEARRA